MTKFVTPAGKEYFFMHHSGGVQSLWDFLITRVHSLRAQLENYVRKYYDVGQMTASERKQYFEAQARSFARIMGTPEYQSMFLSGVPHDDICEFIYAQEQHTLAAQTSKDGVVAARFSNRTRRRKIDIQRARDADRIENRKWILSTINKEIALIQENMVAIMSLRLNIMRAIIDIDESIKKASTIVHTTKFNKFKPSE